jgi:large subunit ribosomal protein L10
VLVIRGGILDGSPVGDADIKRLATLPPAEVLRAQLVGAVAGPLTTVVGLFTAPLRDLVGVIDARIRQLEEQGEGESPADSADAESASSEESAEEAATTKPETTTSAEAEPLREEETDGED